MTEPHQVQLPPVEHGFAGDPAQRPYPGGKNMWWWRGCLCGYETSHPVRENSWRPLMDHLKDTDPDQWDPTYSGTVRWFGPSWGAPANVHQANVATTPVDQACGAGCGVPFQLGDAGVGVPYIGDGRYSWYHRNCYLRLLGIVPIGEDA